MTVDLTDLLIGSINVFSVSDKVDIPHELITDERIIDLKNVHADLTIMLDEDDEIVMEGRLTGVMTLADDVTLEPVEHEFEAIIEENLEKNQNILDITDILWQNILVEIPSKVRGSFEDVELSGDGWRVISEEKYNEEKNKMNNPFSELDKLLDKKEDK